MGRKIPAKKHRGVKDPLEQQAKRLKSLKGKINAPPLDPDEQPAPRSLARLFAPPRPRPRPRPPRPPRRDNDARSAGRGRGGGAGGGAGAGPLAGMRRGGGESARDFALRISSAARALHHPAELYYPLDTEEEDRKGDRMAALRERRLRKRRAPAEPQGGGGAGAKLSRSQKRALKLKEKKNKISEAVTVERAEVQYERVQFGLTAPAPPALPPVRRAPPADRPGRRDLLLCAVLRGGGAARGVLAGAARGAAAGGVGGEGGAGERARLAAVAAYRALKANRANDIKRKR